MALQPCKECKKEISTKAKTCPHCGVKDPGVTTKDVLFGVVILVAIVFGLIMFFSGGSDSDEDKKTPEEIAEELAACKSDVQCWGGKHSVAAITACKGHIERLAKYSSKWTDGMFEPKFSHLKWANMKEGYVTYIGDKIQFENGFGAMQNHIYECDFDPETKAVLAVRANAGSLN